jgi:hypothetical protein
VRHDGRMAQINPFRIAVPDADLDDLRSRLARTRWPESECVGDWSQGMRSWCEDAYNITHWTTMPRGGHFAAFEQPELFVEDVRAFFDTVR